MSKKLIDLIRAKQAEQVAAHMPAKDVVAPSESELSDIARFLLTLDNTIINLRDSSRDVETDGFHPSSLGIAHGKCARRSVYLLQGVAKPLNFSPRILRVFENGHAVHARLQALMERMDIQMQPEIPIVTDVPPICGHADGSIEWMGRKILIEIKSCSPEVYINRLKWKKPKDEHFEQANIYATILDIDVIWIIYENKATQELKIFEKKTNRELAQKQIDEWHAQWLCFQAGELPKRPYKPASSVCAGCDLKVHCFGDAEVGVDLKLYREQVKELHEAPIAV